MDENRPQKIIGWRLDLVRHRRWWKGAEHLKAKLELYALLAKSQWASPPVHVILYMDIETWQRSYQRWLEKEGLSCEFPERFQVMIVDGNSEPVRFDRELVRSLSSEELRQQFMTDWLARVDKVIEESWEADKRLYPEFPPEHLSLHQQSQSDSILAIWSEDVESVL